MLPLPAATLTGYRRHHVRDYRLSLPMAHPVVQAEIGVVKLRKSLQSAT